MNFAEAAAALATKRPVAVVVLAVAVTLVGVLAWRQIPVDLLPDMQSPTVAVSIRAGDRPPTEMERLYGERVEQLLFTVRGIREISQVARTGRIVATVTFDWDTDIELGLVDVQKAVGPLASDPLVDEVLVRHFDPRQSPVLTYGMVATTERHGLAELRRLVRRQIAPGLEQLPGVAEVRVTGGREEEVRIHLDRYRMEAFDITLSEIEERLRNENVDISAGTLEEGSSVFLVRGISRFRSPEDVARVVVRYLSADEGARQAIRIVDLGSVAMVDREIDHLVRVNGVEGVGLAVYKEFGANTVDVSATVRGAMQRIERDLPDIAISNIADDAALVVDALDDLWIAAGIGIVLAVMVLAAFLRSAGATVVVAAAVPVSVLAALFCMHFAEHSLNIITLGGLALGAGMLVDNAIVVVESIHRRLAEAASRDAVALPDATASPGVAASPPPAPDASTSSEAIASGTGQVAGAITASTLTTCVVFLPVLFVEGLAARLIEGIAFTVVVSLLASLAVAVFLIPALARWFMPKAAAAPSPSMPGHRRAMEQIVRRLLTKPLLVVATAAGASALGIAGLVSLGSELLPDVDPHQFSIRVVGPSGQRVESTARVASAIESILNDAAPGTLAAVLSEVGRLPEDSRLVRTELTEENTARLTARVDRGGPTGGELAGVLNSSLDAIPDTEVTWEVGSSALADMLGTEGPPVAVEISGRALADLRRGAELVRQRLAGLPELWNVRSSFEGGPPELRIERNQAVADGLGVDMATIARVLETSLDGRTVTMLSMGDEERPVTLRLDTPTRDALSKIVFTTSEGQRVALGEVVRFVETEGAREIFRRDQRRTALVTADVADGITRPRAIAAVEDALAGIDLPPGLTEQLRGEEAERERTFGELQLAAVLAIVLVFMVLSGSFESLVHPVTVLSAIPFGLIGVSLVLVPLGEPVGVMAMLGLIVLAGVAVNDAVLLLATARRLMAEGTARTEALAEAAGIRLRPIVMTTLTTVLVMLPLVFGTGEGAALRAPMAVTIIGGVIASTICSLFVLPCLYLVLDRGTQSETVTEGGPQTELGA